MRLPTSTVVMTLLTCVPFGLAIRDTIKGDPVADDEDDDDVTDDDDLESSAAEQASAAAAEEMEARAAAATKELLEKQLHELYGAEPASLGSLFSGVELGAAGVDRIEALDARIRTFTENTGVDITTSIEARGLTAITLTPRPYGADELSTCELLAAQLQKAWGPSTESGLGAHWLEPTTGRRASLIGSDDCALVFDKFVTADKFINKSPTSIVPIWAIGLPPSKLPSTIVLNGPAADPDEENGDRIEWDAPGIGASLGSTRLTAYLKRGKIVTITAAANASSAGVEDVVEQISRVTKVDFTGDEVRRWKTSPPIEVDHDHGVNLFVTVGAPQE